MTYEQRKQERQALIEHLLAQDWNVFGTLKFVNGRTIGRDSADKLLRSYCQTNENSHRIAGAALIYALNSWRHSARAAVRLNLKLSRE